MLLPTRTIRKYSATNFIRLPTCCGVKLHHSHGRHTAWCDFTPKHVRSLINFFTLYLNIVNELVAIHNKYTSGMDIFKFVGRNFKVSHFWHVFKSSHTKFYLCTKPQTLAPIINSLQPYDQDKEMFHIVGTLF